MDNNPSIDPLINNPVPQPMPTPTPAPRKNYAPLWVIIAVIVFSMLVAVGGYFLLQNSIRNTTQQPYPSPTPNVASSLTVLDINNATYIIAGTQAQFTDGKFHPERNNAIDVDQGLYAVINSYAFGDINGDGQGDAVVVTEHGTGASSTRTDSLQVVLNVDGKPQAVNTIIPGNIEGEPAIGFEVTSIDSTGLITIQLLSLAGVDAYKIEKTTRTYRYANGVLIEDQAVYWKRWDSGAGFEFKYPIGFDTNYVSWAEEPKAVVITNKNSINQLGCYPAQGALNTTFKDQQVVINGYHFCISKGGEGTAGTSYGYYYYTVPMGNSYVVLQYSIKLPSCGAMFESASGTEYNDCIASHSETKIMDQLKQSVSTFKIFK